MDELEKADHDLLNIFLTILDEGYFTDSTGHRVDCKNLIIIATSNAKSEEYQHIFSPEFLNRFDGIVAFNPLDQNAVAQIAQKMLDNVSQNIFNLYKVRLSVSDNLLNNLIQQYYDPQFGARDLERIIRSQIEDKVAKMVLENKIKEGETINL